MNLPILSVSGRVATSFSIQDLQQGLVTYRHTSGEIGTEKLQDSVKLTVTDNSNDFVLGGNIYSGIVLNLMTEPVDSEAPEINGTYLLNVAEGGETNITEEVLRVKDRDTILKSVICNILEFPMFGFIEIRSPETGSEISRKGVAITKFSSYDLISGHVNYVQNNHKRVEPRNDLFRIKCTDGKNNATDQLIRVSIAPQNDEAPIIYAQNNILCVEDDIVLFDLSKINPFDGDKPEDKLSITVTKQPVNGELLLQKTTELVSATTFTKEALLPTHTTSLMYQHKGTETLNDKFEICISDGVHNVSKTINLTIIAMDDETPRMIVNTGLNVDRFETKVITNRNLKATDLDSDDLSLLYIIMLPPIQGKLQKYLSESNVVEIRKGGNFTQEDINKRRIRY